MTKSVFVQRDANLLCIHLSPPFGPIERMECLSSVDASNSNFSNVLIDVSKLESLSDLSSVKNLLVQLGFRNFGYLAVVASISNLPTLNAIIDWYPLDNPVRAFTASSLALSWMASASNETS